MSGKLIPSVQFPLNLDGCKSSYVEVTPFFSVHGFGIVVKVKLLLTSGTAKKTYEYERTVYTKAMLQNNVSPNDELAESIYEFFEGFYYNKVNQDVVVPFVAMILRKYFVDLLQNFGLDLSDYITEVDMEPTRFAGFRGE